MNNLYLETIYFVCFSDNLKLLYRDHLQNYTYISLLHTENFREQNYVRTQVLLVNIKICRTTVKKIKYYYHRIRNNILEKRASFDTFPNSLQANTTNDFMYFAAKFETTV